MTGHKDGVKTRRMRIWLQLPEELRNADQWIIAKEDKRPLLVGSVLNGACWLPFQTVVQQIEHNITLHPSFVVTPQHGWGCIDIDRGQLPQNPTQWARALRGVYVEESLRGGLHIWGSHAALDAIEQPTKWDRWDKLQYVICTGRRL